ncbi:MAG: hypothetical protein OHK0029_43140 [Armatimonadaceae bacterium]
MTQQQNNSSWERYLFPALVAVGSLYLISLYIGSLWHYSQINPDFATVRIHPEQFQNAMAEMLPVWGVLGWIITMAVWAWRRIGNNR